MKKLIAGTLAALFMASAANGVQADQVSDRLDEINRLNRLYRDMGSTLPELSKIIFLPSIDDDAAYAAYGFDGPSQAANISQLMSFIVAMKFDANVPLQDIYDHVIKDKFMTDDENLSPVSLSALVKTPTALTSACMAFMPSPDINLKKEVEAFVGIFEYEGNNGFMLNSVAYNAPYNYHAEMPISADAWRNFKAHYTAAQCLVDKHNPAQTEPDPKADYILAAATGFAAIMAARDHHHEILPFLADYMAATVHNTSSYDDHYYYAQLIDKNAGLYDGMGTSWREFGDGSSRGYVVPLLDRLTEAWQNDHSLQTMNVEELYNFVLNLALENRLDQSQELAVYSLRADDAPEEDVNQSFREEVIARAQEGAERLNVCVTFDQHWKEYGEREHKDVWGERITRFWTPPVCP